MSSPSMSGTMSMSMSPIHPGGLGQGQGQGGSSSSSETTDTSSSILAGAAVAAGGGADADVSTGGSVAYSTPSPSRRSRHRTNDSRLAERQSGSRERRVSISESDKDGIGFRRPSFGSTSSLRDLRDREDARDASLSHAYSSSSSSLLLNQHQNQPTSSSSSSSPSSQYSGTGKPHVSFTPWLDKHIFPQLFPLTPLHYGVLCVLVVAALVLVVSGRQRAVGTSELSSGVDGWEDDSSDGQWPVGPSPFGNRGGVCTVVGEDGFCKVVEVPMDPLGLAQLPRRIGKSFVGLFFPQFG